MNDEVRRVDLADVLPLRQVLLRPGQPVEELMFEGDPAGVHLAVGAPIIGIASVVPTPMSTGDPADWRIRMVGVVPEHRGAGLGGRLVAACVDVARRAGAPGVWLSARLHLRDWYEALGFVVIGEVYEKPEVGPHVDMHRPI